MDTYQLSNDFLTINFSSLGAEITAIKANDTNKQYLWNGDSNFWSGQAPILFPIVGTLRNHTATIGDENVCHLKRHGFARKMEFHMLRLCKNRIVFSLSSNDETKALYPYDFELHMNYLLEGKTLTTTFSVMNQSDVPMPFSVGGHPAFHCPINKDEAFKDYVVEFEKKETADCAYLTEEGLIDDQRTRRVLENENLLPVTHELFYDDALVFDQLQSNYVYLHHKDKTEGVKVSFPEMRYLGIWSTANDGPFVALEPWSGTATLTSEDDIFEHKRNITTINPGEIKKYSFDIEIITE